MSEGRMLKELKFAEISSSIPYHPLFTGNASEIQHCSTQGDLAVFIDEDTVERECAPIIGITMARVDDRFVVRKRYSDEVHKAGGRAVFVPHVDPELADNYLENLDAVILSGGGDLHPDHWGAKLTQAGERNQTIDKTRDKFELQLTKMAIEREIPILGICRGMQIINVVQGGTLLQGLPSWRTHMPDTNDYAGMTKNLHPVLVRTRTRISSMANESLNRVNSGHHMAVYELGNGLRIGAIAYDRTIEAIEGNDEDNYLIGVQWHPEAMVGNKIAKNLFGSLVENAQKYRTR